MANQNRWRNDRRYSRDYEAPDRGHWTEGELRAEQHMWRERQGYDAGARADNRSHRGESVRHRDSDEYRPAQSGERFARLEPDRRDHSGHADWPREPAYRSGQDYGTGREAERGFYDRDDYGRDRAEASAERYRYEQFDRLPPREDHYGRSNRAYPYGRDRGFIEKASDEVASWFGDSDAEQRRHQDHYRGVAPKGYTRSDDRIREDVNDRFTDDPFIDASDIVVTVANSEVTLSGNVNTRDQRRRAEDVAEYVSGVKHVQNNIRVRRNDALQSSTDPINREPLRQANPTLGNFVPQKPIINS